MYALPVLIRVVRNNAAVLQVQKLLDVRRHSELTSQASSQPVAVVAATLLRFNGGWRFAFCYVRTVVHQRIRPRTLPPLQLSWVQVLWPEPPTKTVTAATTAVATAPPPRPPPPPKRPPPSPGYVAYEIPPDDGLAAVLNVSAAGVAWQESSRSSRHSGGARQLALPGVSVLSVSRPWSSLAALSWSDEGARRTCVGRPRTSIWWETRKTMTPLTTFERSVHVSPVATGTTVHRVVKCLGG